MKKLVLCLIIFFNILPCFSYTTEASKFAEQQYAKQNCLSKVHINVKKEHTIKNIQNFKEQNACAITFGYGDLKGVNIKNGTKSKKLRISYVCLLDKNCMPVWSCINSSE